MGYVQNYEWGTIDWLTDQTRNGGETLDIGLTTIYPGKAQERHIHYGDEQWLYVLSGVGKSTINHVECTLKSGELMHIPAGAAHETMNTGTSPLVKLLISYPKSMDDQRETHNTRYASSNTMVDVSTLSINLNDSEMETINAYSKTLALPINIMNTGGEILVSNDLYPMACKSLCQIDTDVSNCHLYKNKVHYGSPAYSEQTAHYCKYGLAVIDTPIVSDGIMVGIIRGGHILTDTHPAKMHPQLKQHVKNLTNVPKGRLRIILMQYLKLAKHLASHQLNNVSSLKKDDNQGINPLDFQYTDTLKEDLNLALGKILSIQLNNHFLFNTLNAIAGLALDENSFKTYRAVVDLSKLFRYTLRSSQEFVTLTDEVEYIKNYVDLQGIRFGERLTVEFNIDDEALKHYVPFNTLQPLVENAFIHGFAQKDSNMYINISISVGEQEIELIVTDNGLGIHQNQKADLLRQIESSTLPRRGLSMIMDRLQLFFGESARYELFSLEDLSSNQNAEEDTPGFKIKLSLPKRTLKKEMLR